MHEFSFTGVSRLTLAHEKGMATSTHVATDFFLEVSPNLQKEQYIDKEGLPTKEGIKPLTNALIQGVAGAIHMAHENGWWDSAEHLRYAIEQLTRSFAEVANLSKSKF